MTFASAADRLECRRLIAGGSRTFSAASLLLPYRFREAAYALYGFCRLSDDLVDVEAGSEASIAMLRDRLDCAYAQRPFDSPVDRAFADVVGAFAIPRALPEALIDGLESDVAGVRCENIDDVYRYAARVAGSVGAMMSVLMGVRAPGIVARACELGVAMQLTNIARDVGEDARLGRLYLPQSWLRRDGVEPDDWLRQPYFVTPIGTAVGRLLERADELYERASAAIPWLPLGCRAGIVAALRMYREIGVEVARRGYDSVSGRARIGGARKLGLVGRSILDVAKMKATTVDAPPLGAVAHLVEAVAASPPSHPQPSIGRVADRIVWVAELFASLESRDRLPSERT